MNYRNFLIRQLAHTIWCGGKSQHGIAESISGCINLDYVEALPLAGELAQGFHFDCASQIQLENWLQDNRTFAGLYRQEPLKIVRWPLEAAAERLHQPEGPAPADNLGQRWGLPSLPHLEALGQWCRLSPGDLAWYCQLYPQQRADQPRLQHYHYRVISKSNGQPRLLETPKARIKSLQRQLHAELLSKVPTHPAAHGFVAGRSVKTFSAPHVNRAIVVAMDLRQFFLSIEAGRVVRLFQRLGYNFAVSKAMAGLCLNRTPEPAMATLDCLRSRQLHRLPHLPQGAPTSPILANLAAYHLDCRLQGAARKLGFNYTRYADDMAFSSEWREPEAIAALNRQVKRIVGEEGFALNDTKYRAMSQAARQQLAGVVVNKKQSLRKAEVKQLEAILYNCARFGPQSQNRQGHPHFRAWIEGKLAHVRHLAPQHYPRLDQHYQQIRWQSL